MHLDQHSTPEHERLKEDAARTHNWKRWGPYLSERQWGTVREDYSADGDCWNHLPHDHARSRAYRWGEDGLLGFTDRQNRLCFALALWNGKDPILKERLFGLTGPEGNHGEDVKENYYYLDSTPTHSYCKALYKYPQNAYPYDELVEVNARRGRDEPEYELSDTGVFDEGRYFDVQQEYAKGSPNDVLIRVTVTNHGPDRAPLHLLPTLWFRNTWVWGCTQEECSVKPRIEKVDGDTLVASHETLGRMVMQFEAGPTWGKDGIDPNGPIVLFTENETNNERLYGTPSSCPYVKDAFHDAVIREDHYAVNRRGVGTKAAPWYVLDLEPGETRVVKLRLYHEDEAPQDALGAGFDEVFAKREEEADAFYAETIEPGLDPERTAITRQAYAGLLWSKQFYHYVVDAWVDGDPNMPAPPSERQNGRNADWPHVYSRDILSMPDKWEYPWFAAWDLAFHMIPFARIDPAFAKKQLALFLREWYMHPNGQIPAYEFNFSDVNPPVHAWAVWRVYKMTGPRGERDLNFLASCFQKLLINFTWWVNRKDLNGRHVFSGGFLGLDNIGVFDRSNLPDGLTLTQADATAWMAFYCNTMLAMALELAESEPAYSDMASKFFEHFVAIADAINDLGGTGLWDHQDGFYYDQLTTNGTSTELRVRSLVGLLPLIAVEVIDKKRVEKLTGFKRRMDWFLKNRDDLAKAISYMTAEQGHDDLLLLAIPSREKIESVVHYLLDEDEFLSPYGIRSMSKVHERQPFRLELRGQTHTVAYQPGESDTAMFGGNSNWRGPIWFPTTFLLVEALQRYDYFYGDHFKVECPTGSGNYVTLGEAAAEIKRRLARLFVCDDDGGRPCQGDENRLAGVPGFDGLVLFHEYFHAETGRGLGASHQTGWTALIAECMRTKREARR
ncbi:MAG: glucosidase [Planctomycetota bacterium]